MTDSIRFSATISDPNAKEATTGDVGVANGVGEAAIEEMVAVAAVATGARVFPREGLAGAKNSRTLLTAPGEASYPVRLWLYLGGACTSWHQGVCRVA